jgi:hypothetical protein
MLPKDEHLYLDATQLYERGWTETLIKRFLVNPDRLLPVDHWRNYQGKRCYFLGRVEEAEGSDEFAFAFATSAGRRKLSNETVAEIIRKRISTVGQVRQYALALTDKDIELMKAIHKMADVFRDARNHGFRTPHKC